MGDACSSSQPWAMPLAVAMAVVGLVALVVAACIRVCPRRCSHAPRDATRPFCVFFTDVQSSTLLWARVPALMARALAAHHAILRRCARRHRCYEVKTIGDSFMFATYSALHRVNQPWPSPPSRAVHCALDIQHELVLYHWDNKSHLLDAIIDGDRQPKRLGWHGLRVRIGINFGQGCVYMDPVTHALDYYGTLVNVAARVEAACHGGQVGVTLAVREEYARLKQRQDGDHRAIPADDGGLVWTNHGPRAGVGGCLSKHPPSVARSCGVSPRPCTS